MFFATLVSFKEREPRAAKRAFLLAVFLPLPYLFIGLTPFPYQSTIALILISLTALSILILALPIRQKYNFKQILFFVTLELIKKQNRIEAKLNGDTIFSLFLNNTTISPMIGIIHGSGQGRVHFQNFCQVVLEIK